jgi:hypothetical protein
MQLVKNLGVEETCELLHFAELFLDDGGMVMCEEAVEFYIEVR